MTLPHLRTAWSQGSTVLKGFTIVLFLCIMASLGIASTTPVDTVKSGTNEVLKVLKQQSGHKEQRRTGIRKVVDEYFDFNEMAKRALGPRWKEQPPAKQQEFARTFSELLFNVYIDKIERYTDEQITYSAKTEQGDHAVVDALVTGSQTGKIAIEYHLHLKDGNWKAYDVAVEGVDLVNNYRSQFNSILSRSSFDDLLKMLREKNLKGA
jgi:phospholipid transport system substrate-binding protein